ncbi:hypothetical protein SAMN05421642_11741 [Rhodococcoides kyotonense]|uniref:Antitoxin Xre/MbcA/ParS-like toxin-binding domain-containing protein n=2 Tax=Rhodococcoides kyotonense TaxID=398843 RepID=A0A239MDI8_9NOCA|nr:hypothetical protein SAMN05421642_11741 [Rhodococcus kyotonensis]
MAHRLIEASGASDERDLEYARAGLDDIVSGLRARRAWTEHVGDILTSKQACDFAAWTRSALSKAVGENRVLRLEGSNGKYGYAAAGFTDSRPARPIPGIQDVLRVWSVQDPRGWSTVSWFTTEQPELEGRTPRRALLDGDPSMVVRAARAAVSRLAA